jgi:hypothetical protein
VNRAGQVALRVVVEPRASVRQFVHYSQQTVFAAPVVALTQQRGAEGNLPIRRISSLAVT